MSYVVDVDRFTGRFAEELARASDKPEALRNTVAKIIAMYEDLRAAEAQGDATVSVYLDALEDAIDKIDMTDRQEAVLEMLVSGLDSEQIAEKLEIDAGYVRRMRMALVARIAEQFAKAPKKIWK